MGTLDDGYTTSNDFRIGYAEAAIYNTYGVTASVERKSKILDKFGENRDLDTGAARTVWNLGVGGGANETLQTSNTITHIVGGSGDTHTVIVEGHYLDASGNLIFHIQSKTLTATTPVALDQALARCARMYVPEGGVPTGPIDATIGSGGTAVVRIAAGDVQTQKCATSLSYRDYWVILNFGSASLASTSAEITFRLEFRPLFSPAGVAYTNPNWRPLTRDWLLGDGGRAQFPQEIPIIVPANSDVRITSTTTASNAFVTAHIDGYLAVANALADAADPDPA